VSCSTFTSSRSDSPYLAPKVREHVRGDSVVKVDPNDSVVVAKARAAIKDRYNTWARHKLDKTGTGDGTHLLTVQRTCQLERYLRLRYGPVLPDDDAGREDLVIALYHNRAQPYRSRREDAWLRPEMGTVDAAG
jgi:hypothetical protein